MNEGLITYMPNYTQYTLFIVSSNDRLEQKFTETLCLSRPTAGLIVRNTSIIYPDTIAMHTLWIACIQYIFAQSYTILELLDYFLFEINCEASSAQPQRGLGRWVVALHFARMSVKCETSVCPSFCFFFSIVELSTHSFSQTRSHRTNISKTRMNKYICATIFN